MEQTEINKIAVAARFVMAGQEFTRSTSSQTAHPLRHELQRDAAVASAGWPGKTQGPAKCMGGDGLQTVSVVTIAFIAGRLKSAGSRDGRSAMALPEAP